MAQATSTISGRVVDDGCDFNQPIGYLGGIGAVSTIPNSFQVQFGTRLTF